jgi:hypothetical protein
LSNLDALLEVAVEKQYIDEADVSRLLRFRDNPSDESWMEGTENTVRKESTECEAITENTVRTERTENTVRKESTECEASTERTESTERKACTERKERTDTNSTGRTNAPFD